MPGIDELQAQDLHGLSFAALAEMATQMLAHIARQSGQIDSQAQAIKLRDIRIERITHELARLKAWRFGARTERMNAEQRELFEETLAADQASLEAQLEALQAQSGAQGEPAATEPVPRRKPKRQALPEHLQRVEHRHEPENTTCGCGQPMVRVGEDVSEKLDIVPARFFVHRHIRGKWACKCCQALVAKSRSSRTSSTRGCLPRACSPTPWWAASLTTFPTTARNKSMRVRACIRRARRWRPGQAGPVPA